MLGRVLNPGECFVLMFKPLVIRSGREAVFNL